MINHIAALISISIASSLADQMSYDGYKLYEIFPTTANDVSSLMQWEQHGSIELWSSPNTLLEPFDVMVEPKALDEFKAYLEARNIEYKIKIDNFGDLLRMDRMQQELGRHSQLSFSYFYNGSEIDEYIDYLQAEYPQIVEVEVIGESLEGRKIRCVKISSVGRTVDGRRPIIFIDAGIHAREWAAHMSALYLMHNLVEKFEENADILDKVDWLVVPIVNPDGFEYTHEKERFWRKNRRQIGGSSCKGVDLNRNYGYKWMASNNYCGETYSGQAPFSEPETIAIRSALNKYKKSTKVYLSLHSYGDWVLYPWGYDSIKIDNWQQHEVIGRLFAEAAYEASRENYTVGNAAILLYPAAGGSDDYAASIGIEYSYTIEISKGSYGFVLPTNEILRVGSEISAACFAVARFIVKET